jgi:hypothetical protein
MPRRCPEMSSPHPAPGQRPSVLRPWEDGCWRLMVACPARATRRAASASRPRRAEGSAVAMFGPTGSLLVWTCSSAELRALSWRISIHALEYLLTISPPFGSPPWSIFHRSGRKSDRRLFSLTRLACRMVEICADCSLWHRSLATPTSRPADYESRRPPHNPTPLYLHKLEVRHAFH